MGRVGDLRLRNERASGRPQSGDCGTGHLSGRAAYGGGMEIARGAWHYERGEAKRRSRYRSRTARARGASPPNQRVGANVRRGATGAPRGCLRAFDAGDVCALCPRSGSHWARCGDVSAAVWLDAGTGRGRNAAVRFSPAARRAVANVGGAQAGKINIDTPRAVCKTDPRQLKQTNTSEAQ